MRPSGAAQKQMLSPDAQPRNSAEMLPNSKRGIDLTNPTG
jgi:hypothetical protein